MYSAVARALEASFLIAGGIDDMLSDCNMRGIYLNWSLSMKGEVASVLVIE